MRQLLLVVGAVLMYAAYVGDPPAYPPFDASWTRSPSNPILSPSVAWEETAVYEPNVIYDSGWKMWYGGGWGNPAIGYATSSDGITWTKYASNPVLGQGGSGIAGPALRNTVLKVGATYYLYYADANPLGNIKVATSADGIAWTVQGTALANNAATWATGFQNTAVTILNGVWYMLVDGYNGTTFELAYATSADGLTFTLGNSGNQISSLQVAAGGTYGSPELLRLGGVWHAWYLAVNGTGNLPTDIYHATSSNLVAWTRSPTGPVLTHTGISPEVDQVADPDVIVQSSVAYLYYAAMDNASSAGVICVATNP